MPKYLYVFVDSKNKKKIRKLGEEGYWMSGTHYGGKRHQKATHIMVKTVETDQEQELAKRIDTLEIKISELLQCIIHFIKTAVDNSTPKP